MPVRQTMALGELSEEAVRRWYGRFREHLPENVAVNSTVTAVSSIIKATPIGEMITNTVFNSTNKVSISVKKVSPF